MTRPPRCLVAILFAGATLGCASSVAPAVTAGKQMIGIVRFPEMWWPMGAGKFEIRHIANTHGEDLLFGMRSVEGHLSDKYFAVAMDGSFHVRAASAEDWKTAQAVVLFNKDMMLQSGWTGTHSKHTGTSLRAAMPSPDDMMIALLSMTETEKAESSLPWGVRPKGTMYFDLYNTSSGERVGAAEAAYVGVSGDIGFPQATWIGDRAFIVPVDLWAQTCLLAIRPAR